MSNLNFGKIIFSRYGNLQRFHQSGIILAPGWAAKKKNLGYISVDDHKKIEIHPFLLIELKSPDNVNEFYLLPLTSDKVNKLLDYKLWICNCGKKHSDIFIGKKNNVILLDARKSKITKLPSFIKIGQEYKISMTTLDSLINQFIFKVVGYIENEHLMKINHLKVDEKLCLKSFTQSENFTLAKL